MHFASERSRNGRKPGFTFAVSYLRPWSFTEGTLGWATFGCVAGNFGVRGQAKRDPALARSARCSGTLKAPSLLRFAGALQKSRVSFILRTPLYLRFNSRF